MALTEENAQATRQSADHAGPRIEIQKRAMNIRKASEKVLLKA